MVDVDGGTSTSVDDLLEQGFEDVAILDISGKAVEESKKRLGQLAPKAMHGAFDDDFKLVKSLKENHQTPLATTQEFIYCYYRNST